MWVPSYTFGRLVSSSNFAISPSTITSNMPSTGLAEGATRMPPPKYWPFATTIVTTGRRITSPSSTISTRLLFKERRLATTADRYGMVPLFWGPERLARRVTSTSQPIPAKLRKKRRAVRPSALYSSSPTSSPIVLPPMSRWIASNPSRGMPTVRHRSTPRPVGNTARRTPPRLRRPSPAKCRWLPR